MALALILHKRIKNCEAILSKFREEVCRNPDADVAPYTQMLGAEFRTWNKAWEKEIIKPLFLNLYANDFQALRRDLCKLDPPSVLCKLTAHGAAKAKFPQRALLLYCLYGVLSLYHRGDFASIVKICSQGMEPDWGKCEIDEKKHEMDQILPAFKEEISRNPDIDFVPLIVNEYRRMREACIERVMKTLFLNLYGQDAQSLKRDIAKATMFGANAGFPQRTDRADLLQCLYGALSSCIGEGFSDIMEMCM